MKNIKKKFDEIFDLLSNKLKFGRKKNTTEDFSAYPNSSLDPGSENSGLSKRLSKFKNIKNLRSNFVSKSFASYEVGSILKKIGKHVFNVQNRPIIHKIFIFSMLVMLPYLVGKIIAVVLTTPNITSHKSAKIYIPSSVESDLIRDIEKIQMANLFHAKLVNDIDEGGNKKKKVVNENVICTVSQTKSSLPIKIISTIVLQNSAKSIASIMTGGGESDLKTIKEGEKIADMAIVGKIERLKIIFRSLQTGECEYVADDEELMTQARGGQLLSAKEGKKLMNSMKQMEGIKK
ncbi:MAG: hypothetical protein HQK51_06910 [Oligoflexia bacterium]|nr:hypothetical protein [Oligoflexia bacterium]